MRPEEILTARAQLAAVDKFLLSLLEALKPVTQTPVLPSGEAGLRDPAGFWDYIRGDAGELFPVMRASQLAGIQRLMDAGAGKLPRAWMAYLLATVYHETSKTMQPVREGLTVSDDWRRKHLRYYPWYGRGDVQLTWEPNYAKAGKALDVDLIADPDKALDPSISARIVVEGMLAGWFTGKSLRDYIPAAATFEHFKNARRIINVMDKAELIAGYAVEFDTGLHKGDWQ